MSKRFLTRRFLLRSLGLGLPFALYSWPAPLGAQAPRPPQLKVVRRPGVKPRNILMILTDDHRFDAMGFVSRQGYPHTPTLDGLARDGVHFKNACVTTALCSPSRASILTSLYAHQHRVVDNNHPIAGDLVFFPQYLQRAGYRTAFVGKWHMGGESDAPQRGFHHWVSFPGQGTYLPSPAGLNVNGQRVAQKGYITDELTEYALEWLEQQPTTRPFFLCVAHKAVHAEFIPAQRHLGRYEDREFVRPATWDPEPGRQSLRPMWAQNQRNSWHGVDFPYHTTRDVSHYYKRYAETLLAVDESTAQLLDQLRRRGQLDSTLVLYMSDNGFAFGEHGLIDKRTAYEESMRIPMLMRCPELFKGGTVVDEIVANIDVAPSLLEAAGLMPAPNSEGGSVLPLARGERVPWRDALLYEYYWERNFPQTPTTHAVRNSRYKYVHYHGIWDIDELYDLQADPLEADNLIHSPGHEGVIAKLNAQLFEMLKATGGMGIPLAEDAGEVNRLRRTDKAKAAEFPPELLKPPGT